MRLLDLLASDITRANSRHWFPQGQTTTVGYLGEYPDHLALFTYLMGGLDKDKPYRNALPWPMAI
jgi:hypothetical protein